MTTIDKTDARLSKLKEYLSYDPDTGVFSCIKPSGKRKVGDLVGTINGRYLQIGFGMQRERAHRLAWLYVHGEMPKVIDHINGNGLDNRLCNLRNVSQQENVHNYRNVPKHNKTGYLGVSYFKATNKFSAYVTNNYKKIHLGYFDDPKVAHQAYLTAKRKLHTSCTI
jgi:hypothetical protein